MRFFRRLKPSRRIQSRPSPIILAAEYLKPANAADVPKVWVTIYDPVAKAKAAELLRGQLQLVAATQAPTADILATAWDADENIIGDQLVYRVADKSIVVAGPTATK